MLDALWPDLRPERGAANLHKAAHHVRRATGCDATVVLGDGLVRLWPDDTLRTDVEEIEAQGRRALQREDAEACAAAAAHCAPELLPSSRYTPWVHDAAQRLALLRRDLLRTAGQWELLLELDPADEAANEALMRRALERGDADGAVRRYRQLCTALAELGLRPGPRAVALYEDAVRTAADRPAPARPPVFGRDRELREARRVLRGAATGEGGTLLIEGPLGIGKTRIGLAITDEATDAGWRVLRTAASDTDSPQPYGPVAAAVGRLLASQPELRVLLSEGARTQLDRLMGRLDDGSTPLDAAGVSTALLELLEHAAGLGTSVLFVDDVHDADAATVALLGDLADGVRFAPVVLVLALRDDELTPPLLRLRRRLLGRRVCTRLALAPLEPAEAASLARRSAPREPGDATLAAIWKLAEGNPFFTQELAAAIGPDGAVATPGNLTEVVAARLEALPDDVREALQRLAVAGAAFAARDLHPVAGLADDERRRLLDTALRHGVIVTDGDRYRFRHGLIREALLAGLPDHVRTRVHVDAAERLIAAGAPAARVAHHLESAADPRCGGWFARAARDALRVAAYTDALAFADRGLARADDGSRRVLLETRGDALLGLGDPSAVTVLGAALEGAEDEDEARLRIKQARACLAVGAVDAAHERLEGLTASAPAEEARLLLVRALIAWHRDQLEEAECLTADARSLALTEGLTFESGEVLGLEVMVAHSRGLPRLTSLSQWMEAYAAPGLASLALDPHLCVADYLLTSDEPAEVLLTFGRRVLDATRTSRSLRGQAFATLVLGSAQLAHGDLGVAGNSLREAVELHRRVGSVAGEVLAMERLAELARQTDRLDDALRLLDEAAAASQWSPMCAHLLARAHATRVRVAAGAAALEAVAAAERALADRPPCAVCSVSFLLAASIACAQNGQDGRASEYLGRAEGLGGPIRVGPLGAALAAARGEMALANEQFDLARRWFVDAAGRYEQLGHRGDVEGLRGRIVALAAS